jgi:hypothetical protein
MVLSLADHLQRVNRRRSSTATGWKAYCYSNDSPTETTDECSVISFSSFSANSRSFRPEDSISSMDLQEHELAVLDISLVDAVRQAAPPEEALEYDDDDDAAIEIEEEGVEAMENDPLASFLLDDSSACDDEEPEEPSSPAEAVTDFLQDRWFTFTRNLDTINHNWSTFFHK